MKKDLRREAGPISPFWGKRGNEIGKKKKEEDAFRLEGRGRDIFGIGKKKGREKTLGGKVGGEGHFSNEEGKKRRIVVKGGKNGGGKKGGGVSTSSKLRRERQVRAVGGWRKKKKRGKRKSELWERGKNHSMKAPKKRKVVCPSLKGEKKEEKNAGRKKKTKPSTKGGKGIGKRPHCRLSEERKVKLGTGKEKKKENMDNLSLMYERKEGGGTQGRKAPNFMTQKGKRGR